MKTGKLITTWVAGVILSFGSGVGIGIAAFTPAQASHGNPAGGGGHPASVTTLELSATRVCNDDGSQDVTWQTTTQVNQFQQVIVRIDPPGQSFQFQTTLAVNTGTLHVLDVGGHSIRAQRFVGGEGKADETIFRTTPSC